MALMNVNLLFILVVNISYLSQGLGYGADNGSVSVNVKSSRIPLVLGTTN